MATRECLIKNCNRPAPKDLCKLHRERRKNGTPMDAPVRKMVHGLSLSDRFWQHVDIRTEDECWEWQAGRSDQGYGKFHLDSSTDGPRSTVQAHRVAYMLTHGALPANWGLHLCDNPPCCNPRHIYDGTPKENSRDMHARGRNGWDTGKYANRDAAVGERHHSAKVTEDQVREIRRLYATGTRSQDSLAKEFGINQSKISKIVRRVSWKHIE